MVQFQDYLTTKANLNSLQIYQNQNELVLLEINKQTRTSTNRLNVQNVLTLKDKTIQTYIHFLWNTQQTIDSSIVFMLVCACWSTLYAKRTRYLLFIKKQSDDIVCIFIHLYIFCAIGFMFRIDFTVFHLTTRWFQLKIVCFAVCVCFRVR